VRILTLLKYSLDVAEIKVDPASYEIKLAGVPLKIGNIDKNVVEAAAQLKEAFGGELLGLSYAPASARESYRDVLAMGIDEVTLVEEVPGAQIGAASVVKILEAAIRKMGQFDLVMCGFASDDGYSYQVGPRLAYRLGLPLLSYVRKIKLEDGSLIADRDLDDSVETIRLSPPAVVSVAEEAFPPRRTTLMDALKAKKKPVHVWKVADDLGLSIDELCSNSEAEIISQKGIVVKRKQNILKGEDMSSLADSFLDALVEEGILKGKV
jgi:electron transfer flavoprotein beta subunit